MGFLQQFRHDPVRAIGHWYQSRQEMSRYKKRLKAERLWNESLDLQDRLYGTDKKDYRSRYQAIVAMQKASKDKKTIENKAVKPWLYARLFGVPRMVDCMQLRQLAETPIAQLCISTKRAFVKNTPWMIVESDPSEKQLKQIKSLYKDKKERRRAIRNARKKEVSRLLTLSMVDRVKDPRWKELRKKATSEDSKPNALIDEASQLLSSPNNTNRPFSHYLSMAVVDLEEVGSATWVLKFAPEDFEDAMTDKGTPYTKPKKGAKPLQFDSFDTLQFTKDEDDYGDLLGYYHFMRGWTSVGISGKPRYMSKGEIVWFETDPRPNRPYGVSNTEKAAPDLDLNQLLLEQITTYSAEGLQSPGMLSLKGEGWTPDEFDKFKIYMQEDVKGHPEVFPIVDKEAQWVPFTQNFRESQYLERELWRAKNIAGQFQMNMTVIGLEDGETNRATAFAHITLALDLKGAGPMLKDLEYAINTQLIWKYFSPDKRITFFFDPALNAEERERTEVSAIRKWEAGLIKKDEARTDMGHEALGPENGGEDFRDDGMGADTGLGLGSDFFSPEKSMAQDTREGRSPKKKTLPQTIIFDKKNGWTKSNSEEWCITNDYQALDVRETDKQIRIKQNNTNASFDGYIIDIDIDRGITAYVCEEPKQDTKEEEGNGSDDLGVSEIEETDYDRLYRGVSTVYSDYINAVLTELGKHQDLFDTGKSIKVAPRTLLSTLVLKVAKNTGLIQKTVNSITKVVGPSVAEVVREQSIELNLSLDNIDESSAIERFTQKRMSYYEDIPDTLSEDVLDTLVKGIEEGKSYQEVRNDLMAKREDFTRARAETIARTELARSRREAKLLFAEKHQDILVKVWKATPGRTASAGGNRRDSHRAMDGKTVNIDEPFVVNYSLDNRKYPSDVKEMYPGESKYAINCTCSMVLRKKGG